MRPFEAQRRVYLIYDADTMNEDAADALLKDLEEPPPYAVIVLVASDLGPLPETIRSRCQHVPFRRLSERAVREELEARAPGMPPSRRPRSRASPAAGSTASRVSSTPLAEASRRAALARARRLPRSRVRAGGARRAVLASAAERGTTRARLRSRSSNGST